MLEIKNLIHIISQTRQLKISDKDRKTAEAKLAWQQETLDAAREHNLSTVHSVQAMMDYLGCHTTNSIARMYAEQMITQFQKISDNQDLTPVFETVDDWLMTMNYVIQRAPEYTEENQAFFPMSSLFVFYMFTPSGAALFRMEEFNSLLTTVLKDWCRFLDSPESQYVLDPSDGWLSQSAQVEFCLDQCENFRYRGKPYWNFSSYNDFFHRKLNLRKYRPLDGDDDDTIIVSANDGTVYRIAENVKACTEFWNKGQNYSLVDMLDGHYVQEFAGGDVMQSFLDGSDYHRWHAPVSGKVLKTKIIQGLTFSELLSEGLDLSAGTKSQGYEAMVNTRGLVVIENPTLGKVAILPVGITEISSITINVEEGDELKKGDELGYFSYGGSTLVLVFEKGKVVFTAQEPDVNDDDIPVCKTVDNCHVGCGCLTVRSQIATAAKPISC